MKINIGRNWILFLGASVLTIGAVISCVEKYWPDFESKYENILVVDGKITNEPGPYTVKLSISSPIENHPVYIPLPNAIVTISDNEGHSEILSESEPGVYMTSGMDIQGIAGRMYKLTIVTNGQTYESEFEELLAPIGIESAEFKEETHLSEDSGNVYVNGYQFYITTQTATNNKNYFYWELEEVYEYHSAYPIEYYWDGDPNSKYFTTYDFEDLKKLDDRYAYHYCYATNIIEEIFVQKTEHLSTPQIVDLPLYFIANNDERNRNKYSLLIKQCTISQKAYEFYKRISDNISNNEDKLYTKQPYQIRGNLVNINGPDEPVFGYFLVASVSSSDRFFIPPAQLDYADSLFLWSMANCNVLAGPLVGPIGTSIYDYLYRLKQNRDISHTYYIVYATLYPYRNGRFVYLSDFHLADEYCADCRKKGGTTQKPDFWDQ